MYYLAIIATIVGILGAVCVVLLEMATRRIEDEITYLTSGSYRSELFTVDDYNSRYAKCGIRLDPNQVPPTPEGTMLAPFWARQGVLIELNKMRKSRRNMVTVFGIIAPIAGGVAAILFAFGL